MCASQHAPRHRGVWPRGCHPRGGVCRGGGGGVFPGGSTQKDICVGDGRLQSTVMHTCANIKPSICQYRD